MKQTYLMLAAAFLAVVFTGSVLAQKQNFPSKLKDNQSQMVDTRIDNMGYWGKLAEQGVVPVAQPIPVAPAVYTGSLIEAKGVMGAKEDSPDVPVTDATNVTESENSIFVDPSDPDYVLNSNNSTSWSGGSVGTLYGANYFMSDDAGLTWGGSVQGAGGGNSGDPATAISLDGSRMYINFIHGNGGQGVARSTDGGNTWTSAVCGTPPGGWNILDKNHMWIDNGPISPHEGNLYVAWTGFGNSNDSEIEFVRSTDGGVSWSSHLNISSAVNAGSHNQGVNIQTGPNGEVYAIWTIYDGWPQDEKAIGFAKSTDGGATFSPAVRIIDNIRGIRNSGVNKSMRVNSFPVMAVDISGGQYNGNIYVTWTNIGVPGINSGSDADVYMIKSEDEGATWSDPIKVNQDASGLGKKHYLPWITCDPENGILSAVFYDDRDVSGSQVEVFCANSFDGGETWEDFKVSDVAFTPSPIPGLASSYMGDYLGISARGSKVYPVWTDNRNGTYMAWVSPYVTNNLPKPTDLDITLDDGTGAISLEWLFNNSKDFLYFNVYRDGALLGTTTDLTYSDDLPDYGIFQYSVTAMHDEGESVAASGFIQWGNPHIAADQNAVNVVLAPGETTTEILTLENTGELDLEYTIDTDITSKKDPKSYCDASGGCDEYISQVILGDINNSSSCDGYADYTDQSTVLNADETYDITIVNGNVYSSDDLGIWIDWNQDEDFDDAGENVVCEGDNGGEGTFSFTVPSNAVPGDTRMRIRIKWSGSDCGDPCGTTSYGEVEDYTVSVLGWLIVDPTAGLIEPGDSEGINLHFDASELTEGTYTADLNISSNDPDMAMMTIPVTLLVGEGILQVTVTATPGSVCEGEQVQLMASALGGNGSYTYNWTSDPAGFTSTDPDPVVYPDETTTYMVEVSDGSNTVNGQTEVEVDLLPEVCATPTGETEMCQDSPNSTYNTSGAVGALSYNWMIEPTSAGTISGGGDVGIVDWNMDFSGTATISVVGVNDCGDGEYSEELEVMIHATPEVTMTPFQEVYLNTPPFELTNGSPAGGTYTGNGVVDNMFYPEQAGMGIHTITYTYADGFGCENFAEEDIYVDDVSGIAEKEQYQFDVFPNPNKGSFVVSVHYAGTANLNLKVMNNTGMVVYRENDLAVSGNLEKSINLGDLSQGIYFINIYNDDINLLKKVVVRK
ncbi:MAG: T9SS type A sorting domain-containing protein [Bacteroidales bacterium]|nr:T9SS type A sorting domain-containing protein [Bacteroidales bacterium]